MSKAGWIVALIFAVVCVFLLLKKSEQGSPVIPGVITRVDTVVVHDTIMTVKTVKDFTVSKKLLQTLIEGSEIDSGVPPPKTIVVDGADSSRCYSFEQEYANGAYARAEMCSRYFPELRPWDLCGAITYRPGNDTVRTLLRVDTIPRIVFKKPVIPTWQAVTLGIVAGLVTGIFIKK